MYHRPGANALHDVRPRSAQADGRRHLPRPQHTTRRGHPAHRLHDPDRLLRELRLVVADHAREGDGLVPGQVNGPGGTPYGMYDGAVVLSRKDDSMVVPVSVAVAAQAAQDASGKLTGAMQFGGPDGRRRAARPALQQRLGVRRQRLGRGVPSPATGGSSSSTCPRHRRQGRCSWPTRPGTTGPVHRPRHADLRRVGEHVPALDGHGPFGAPYMLDTVGGSENTNIGAGVWTFDTATGGDAGAGHRPGPGGPARARPAPGRLGRRQVRRAVHDDSSARPPSTRRRRRQTTATDTRLVRRDVHVEHRPRRADGRGVRPQPAGRSRPRRPSRTTRTIRRRRASRGT